MHLLNATTDCKSQRASWDTQVKKKKSLDTPLVSSFYSSLYDMYTKMCAFKIKAIQNFLCKTLYSIKCTFLEIIIQTVCVHICIFVYIYILHVS